MFLHRETLVFSPGYRNEGLARLAWMHGLMSEAPGFCGASVAKYLGDATRFAVLRVWQDDAAFEAFHARFVSQHAGTREHSFYRIEETDEWPCLTDSPGDSSGGFLVLVRRTVPAESWEDHRGHRTGVDEIALSLGGVVRLATFRSPDGTAGLSLRRFTDRAAFERFFDSAQHVEATGSFAPGVAHVWTRCYEIVEEVVPT